MDVEISDKENHSAFTSNASTWQDLHVLGCSYRTCGLDTRGAFHLPPEQNLLFQQRLSDQFDLEDLLILNTCNRFEIYVFCKHPEDILSFIAQYFKQKPSELHDYFYHHQGMEAMRHGISVAAGTDSMVFGEPQISGQFKTAYQFAKQVDTLSPKLDYCYNHMIRIAKEIRRKTQMDVCPASIASHAVDALKSQFSHICTQNIVIIGAGHTAQLLAEHLSQAGAKSVTVANRKLTKAQALANPYNYQSIDLQSLDQHMATTNCIISATSAKDAIITKAWMAQQCEKYPEQNYILFDLAAPYDIEPEVGDLEAVQLVNLDHFPDLIQKFRVQQTQAAHLATQLISQHLGQFNHQHHIGATISKLRKKVHSIAELELQKSVLQLQNGAEADQVMTEFARKLANKILHEPTVSMHQNQDKDTAELIHFVEKIFQL